MNMTFPTLIDLRAPALTQALQHKLDNKTKPQGSLGRLEALALQIGQILGTETPQLQDPQMVVFAVPRVNRQRHGLEDYLLAPEMVARPPVHIDGFLVVGSRCVENGELCLVMSHRQPSVRYEGRV